MVATRKLTAPLSRPEARQIVDLYSAWPVVVIGSPRILNPSRIEVEHRLSFWDALVLQGARVAGADLLLTDDLRHGQVIDGVRIVNPFQTASG